MYIYICHDSERFQIRPCCNAKKVPLGGGGVEESTLHSGRSFYSTSTSLIHACTLVARDLLRYVSLFFFLRRGTNSCDDFRLQWRGRGGTKGRENRWSQLASLPLPLPPPDWLINIKMPVLVKGIVYIYYGRYMDREGGVIVSDCYSYSRPVATRPSINARFCVGSI